MIYALNIYFYQMHIFYSGSLFSYDGADEYVLSISLLFHNKDQDKAA